MERPALFGPVLVFLLGIGLLAEFRSYARPDIGFLLDAASRVLEGARLYVDVVEINPPLIIALNAVAVWAARILGLPDLLVYRLGLTVVLLGALWLSAVLLRDIVHRDAGLRRHLVLALVFVLFPLAGPDYGEREHLVLALSLPYLILVGGRILRYDAPRARAVTLGLLAGIAFALKPHFLLLWFLVEAFLRATRRVPLGALLPESLAITGFLGTYLLLIALVTPEYLELLGLLAGPYTRFLYDPFLHLLVTGPGAVLALFALLAFVALRPQARHPALWVAVALGTAAALVAGAAQQKGLRYHFYPAVGLATLMLALAALDSVHPASNRVRLVYRSLVVGVLAATISVVCVRQVLAALGKAEDPGRPQFERMVRLVRARAANAGVFVMSYHIQSAYPLINYAGAHSASRFPHLWILAAEYLDALKSDRPLRFRNAAEMSPSERYLNRAVLEDLGRRPKLLLVFRPARDVPANGYRRLDYIAYFSRDSAIGRLLREYQLVAETGDYLIYEWVPTAAPRLGPPPAVNPGTHDAVLLAERAGRLRIGDPALLIGGLAFLGGMLAMWLSAGGLGRGQPPDGAPGE